MPKRLKFKWDIPFCLEIKLINKYGYKFESRKYQESVIFVQREENTKTSSVTQQKLPVGNPNGYRAQ